MPVTGKRVYPDEDGYLPSMGPGDYGQHSNGTWYAFPPSVNAGSANAGLGNLSTHKVEEHGDSTITVSPSILIHKGRSNEWHGYLKKGIWTEC